MTPCSVVDVLPLAQLCSSRVCCYYSTLKRVAARSSETSANLGMINDVIVEARTSDPASGPGRAARTAVWNGPCPYITGRGSRSLYEHCVSAAMYRDASGWECEESAKRRQLWTGVANLWHLCRMWHSHFHCQYEHSLCALRYGAKSPLYNSPTPFLLCQL